MPLAARRQSAPRAVKSFCAGLRGCCAAENSFSIDSRRTRSVISVVLEPMSSSNPQRVKPPALRPGDSVGIVAPASNIKQLDLDAGCDALRRAGYRPFYLDSILQQDLYFAGSADRRAKELEEMFLRDDIRAILCARGGYGANYLLPRLDL